MKCVESIELLSEYHAGVLDEALVREVRIHLADCPPCGEVMSDLVVIVETAHVLRDEHEGILFPDENAIWSRIRLFSRERDH